MDYHWFRIVYNRRGYIIKSETDSGWVGPVYLFQYAYTIWNQHTSITKYRYVCTYVIHIDLVFPNSHTLCTCDGTSNPMSHGKDAGFCILCCEWDPLSFGDSAKKYFIS